jgi:hypothetical protein
MPIEGPISARRVADAVVSRANLYFVHPVIGTIPRMVWGNDAGFRGNIKGNLDRLRGRRAYEAANGGAPEPTSESAELDAHGFAVVTPEYAPGAFERVRDQYRAKITDDAFSRWNGIGKHRQSSRAIITPRRTLEGVDALITPKLRATLAAHYRGWFEVITVQAWRTSPLEGLEDETAVEAYSNQWHNDRYPTSWVRLFVYLSDGVTKETGAFRCHPVESTQEICRSGQYLQRSRILPGARRKLEDESRIAYFEGDAGASCLANAQLCLHRAGVPRAGYERDILAFTFRPSTRPLPERWATEIPDDPIP